MNISGGLVSAATCVRLKKIWASKTGKELALPCWKHEALGPILHFIAT